MQPIGLHKIISWDALRASQSSEILSPTFLRCWGIMIFIDDMICHVTTSVLIQTKAGSAPLSHVPCNCCYPHSKPVPEAQQRTHYWRAETPEGSGFNFSQLCHVFNRDFHSRLQYVHYHQACPTWTQPFLWRMDMGYFVRITGIALDITDMVFLSQHNGTAVSPWES